MTPEGVLPSDMAVTAACEAMERGGIRPEEIDAIIYAGLTRDYLEPATAHLVQTKLGATNATVFDVTNACHGFMNGIHLMDALIATGQVRRGLVVTGEQGSLFTRKAIAELMTTTDRARLTTLAAGFTLGDAGAAMIMGPKIRTRQRVHGLHAAIAGTACGFLYQRRAASRGTASDGYAWHHF